MGQKVHPLGFRLGVTQKHQSQWFADSRNYSQFVLEDSFLRETISSRFPNVGISQIRIQRKLNQIIIEIDAARANVIVRYGLEKLKEDLISGVEKHRHKRLSFPTFSLLDQEKESQENKKSVQISIHVTELTNPDFSASFIANVLAEKLEKRIAFRRAVRQGIRRSQIAGVKGIKIQISGRLNGAEIARTEWVRKGRVPLQTIRADIDYSYRTAKTIYGLLGIKVWVFKGEII